MQVPAFFASRTVVISGGASWAEELGPWMSAVAPVAESVARKRRRFCLIRMIEVLHPNAVTNQAVDKANQPFSSRLSSLKKLQFVPCTRILLGVDLIMPASRSRSA